MEYVVGFLIALFIALTGVGAGTVTVPILVLFLGVPAAAAVSIGLMFSAAVKLILVPAQVVRGTVAWRTLGLMLAGGVPGVLIGSLLLKHLVHVGSQNTLNAILGAVLVSTASWQLVFLFRSRKAQAGRPDRSRLLPWLMLPVGAEVGFSSAGAGALGSAALLGLTPLLPAQVVGPDIAFGVVLALIGLLVKLIAGGCVGALFGAALSTHIPRRPLRVALWVWLLILGGQFLSNSFHAQAVQARQTAGQAEHARARAPR